MPDRQRNDADSDPKFESNSDPGDESDFDTKRESESVDEGFGHPDSLRESE
jgi:hypothetical protein